MAKRIIMVGIGGASCSGKTTLAKHLAEILPNATLLHQDDYAPPEEEIPVHPVHGVKDWDWPTTAIEWPRFRDDLKRVKDGHASTSKVFHEHLDLLTPVPISEDVISKWKATFSTLPSDVRFVLIDGFIMYWHEEISQLLDLRFLIRTPKSVLEQRRTERNERIAQDSFWKDPPGIFDKVVWPAYVEAHGKEFVDDDVETGAIRAERGIELLEADRHDMQSMVEQACSRIQEVVSAGMEEVRGCGGQRNAAG